MFWWLLWYGFLNAAQFQLSWFQFDPALKSSLEKCQQSKYCYYEMLNRVSFEQILQDLARYADWEAVKYVSKVPESVHKQPASKVLLDHPMILLDVLYLKRFDVLEEYLTYMQRKHFSISILQRYRVPFYNEKFYKQLSRSFSLLTAEVLSGRLKLFRLIHNAPEHQTVLLSNLNEFLLRDISRQTKWNPKDLAFQLSQELAQQREFPISVDGTRLFYEAENPTIQDLILIALPIYDFDLESIFKKALREKNESVLLKFIQYDKYIWGDDFRNNLLYEIITGPYPEFAQKLPNEVLDKCAWQMDKFLLSIQVDFELMKSSFMEFWTKYFLKQTKPPFWIKGKISLIKSALAYAYIKDTDLLPSLFKLFSNQKAMYHSYYLEKQISQNLLRLQKFEEYRDFVYELQWTVLPQEFLFLLENAGEDLLIELMLQDTPSRPLIQWQWQANSFEHNLLFLLVKKRRVNLLRVLLEKTEALKEIYKNMQIKTQMSFMQVKKLKSHLSHFWKQYFELQPKFDPREKILNSPIGHLLFSTALDYMDFQLLQKSFDTPAFPKDSFMIMAFFDLFIFQRQEIYNTKFLDPKTLKMISTVMENGIPLSPQRIYSMVSHRNDGMLYQFLQPELNLVLTQPLILKQFNSILKATDKKQLSKSILISPYFDWQERMTKALEINLKEFSILIWQQKETVEDKTKFLLIVFAKSLEKDYSKIIQILIISYANEINENLEDEQIYKLVTAYHSLIGQYPVIFQRSYEHLKRLFWLAVKKEDYKFLTAYLKANISEMPFDELYESYPDILLQLVHRNPTDNLFTALQWHKIKALKQNN